MANDHERRSWLTITLRFPVEVFRQIIGALQVRTVELHEDACKETDPARQSYWRQIAHYVHECAEQIRKKLGQ